MRRSILGFLVFLFACSQSFALYNPEGNMQSCEEGEVCIMTLSTEATFIELPTYSSQDDFELAEGYICSSATDGVNTFIMKEGKVFAGTKMGYPENFSPEWKCNMYLSESMGDWSVNNRNHFNSLLSNINVENSEKVQRVVERVNTFLVGKSLEKRLMYKYAILDLVDTLKMEISLAHPQDIALPEEQSQIYNMLSLTKYLVMLSE